ncbi:MAG TPA: VOC family protein [Vicinamibacterales bacterium]|nr:VOC family protein [Vicinamibacterales bacterium]
MSAKPIPEGFTAVTPYLIVGDGNRLLDFVKTAFGAEIHGVFRDPGGRLMHADFTIGGAHVMVGEASEQVPEKLGSIHLYVPDVDATYAAALAAGATSVYEPTTHFYGDRGSGVVDPVGVTWWISTHVEDVTAEEMERRMAAAST